MHLKIISFCLLASAVLIRHNQCMDFERLRESERDFLRHKSLNFTRFLIAQRVDSLNPEVQSKKSVQDLLKTDVGRKELITIENWFSEYVETSTEDYYLYYKELFAYVYQTLFASGYLQKWPRYYYDNDTSEIVMVPEVISLEFNISADDFGPPVPKLEKLYLLSTEEIMAMPADIFKDNQEWIEDTPETYQDSNLYELNHIIPLPVLASFCDLFSAVWYTIGAERQKMLSVPFRIANALDMKYQAIAYGEKISDTTFSDMDEIKYYLGNESNVEYDVKKYILWAPGNLFYGPKNRVKLAEDQFHADVEAIIGKELSKLAESIYNRIYDILGQVEYNKIGTSIESKKEKLEKIAERINSDDFLLTQVKEIIFELVHFGRLRDFPFQVDPTQWKQDDDDKWEISFSEYLKQKDFETDERFFIANMIYKGCYNSLAVMSNEEYTNLEYFELQGILTNESNVIHVLKNYFDNFLNRSTASLTDLSEFVREEVQSYYFDRRCDKKNLLCSKVDTLCQYNIKKNLTLIKDKSTDSKNRICPDFSYKKHRFLSTISFKEWCSGRRFENINQLTTDSAVIQILTFNTSKPDTLNERIYCDLYEKYDARERDIDFVEFVDKELQKVDSTASKILNQACKIYKESTKQMKAEEAVTFEGITKEWCHFPHFGLFSIYFCTLDKVFFGLPTALITYKVRLFP